MRTVRAFSPVRAFTAGCNSASVRAHATLCAIVCVISFASVAEGAEADDSAGGNRPHPSLSDLPGLILDPWMAAQRFDGRYERPSGSAVWDAFGMSSIAYAALMKAHRTGDEAAFKSSMRAFRILMEEPIPVRGVFFRTYAAAAYNFAAEHYGDRTEFRQISGRWADRLRRIRYGDVSFRTGYRYNKNVVEALEVLELLKTGLRSTHRGTVLRNRGAARRRAIAVLRRQLPLRVKEFSVTVGPEQGWPRPVTVADISDIPDNPPAYNALVASMYVRAVGLLPLAARTSAMRHSVRTMVRGIVARMPPDGDLSFTGRTQELAWSLTSAMHAAWWTAKISGEPERPMMIELARRALDRLKREHIDDDGAFLLTPAHRCCRRDDIPKGHDVYFDTSNYSGLTAVALEWALEEQPKDWASEDGRLPADGDHTYLYPHGRGRFIQHRSDDVYWFLRGQGNGADARLDMGVSVMKARRRDGTWADIVPPHPLTGGHHLKADPAGPCLRTGLKGTTCAYLQLHHPQREGDGYRFAALWRTPRRTVVHAGSAWVFPTPFGVELNWSTLPGQIFQVDHFLDTPRCIDGGVAAPGLLVWMRPQTSCRIVASGYASATRTDLTRVRAMLIGDGGDAAVDYRSSVD